MIGDFTIVILEVFGILYALCTNVKIRVFRQGYK